MADVTIEELASDVNTTVDRIIQQFADAGIKKQAGQMVNEEEKKTLLDHLSRAHGGQSAEPSKLTLVRKEKTTLSVAGGAGRNREIQVEVRKQKTFVKRPSGEEAAKLAEEERIAAALESKYDNQQVWHYKGGYTDVLEEQLILARPAHDDIKDALASAVEICVRPKDAESIRERSNIVQFHPRFGGVRF